MSGSERRTGLIQVYARVLDCSLNQTALRNTDSELNVRVVRSGCLVEYLPIMPRVEALINVVQARLRAVRGRSVQKKD